jgi:serine protease
MRRFLSLMLLVTGAALPLFSAEQAVRAGYIVTTRGPAREVRLNLIREMAARRFEALHGFTAQLTAAEVAELRSNPDVLFVEEDVERHAIGFVPEQGGSGGSLLVARPFGLPSITAAASTQEVPYGVDLIEARKVWEVGRGRTIRVAVIDTGIVKEHPDVAADYKGGFDFVNEDDDPADDNGHGTHVAGTIAAADNDIGVVGVAPEIEIFALKVLDSEGSGRVSNIVRAIDWAITNRINIINMSLGSSAHIFAEEQALQRAADAGIVAVAASGNSYTGVDGIDYPANYPSVLSVGAVNGEKAIASFSQRGSALRLVAPGVGVLSLAQTMERVIAGEATYEAFLMEGSPLGSVTSPFVFSGLGRTTDFTDAVQGKIALIERGEITFREKVQNAKNAGAAAAVVYNNVPGPFRGTLIRDENEEIIPEAKAFQWPLAVSLSREDGQKIRLLEGAAITVSAQPGGYTRFNGTSMASPHVAGAAALVWSIAATATAQQVRQALLDGALDLGTPGFDTTFGFGIVNAYNAARRLAPEKFPTVPRRRGARP